MEKLVKHESHEGLFFRSYCRAPKPLITYAGVQKSETTRQSALFIRGSILHFHCGLLPYLLLIMYTCVSGLAFCRSLSSVFLIPCTCKVNKLSKVSVRYVDILNRPHVLALYFTVAKSTLCKTGSPILETFDRIHIHPLAAFFARS